MSLNTITAVEIAQGSDSRLDSAYPDAPFNPPRHYPEFSGSGLNQDLDADNGVYDQVRRLFKRLEMDPDNIDTGQWRPFRRLIEPGGKVTIKPNLVFHEHPLGEPGFLSMVTHASIIRPIIDYLILSTQGDVEITICDAPLQSADLKKILQGNGLGDLLSYYESTNANVRFNDIRWEVSDLDDEGLIVSRVPGERDRKGYAVVDLGNRSAFTPIIEKSSQFEITDYPSGTVAKHHNAEKNEYLIGKSILDCDLFINVPKLKTHRKAGITVAMKNLIGINGDKSWIAHHRSGSTLSGGDEFDHFRPVEYFKWHLNAGLKTTTTGLVVNRALRKIYRFLFWRGQSIKERQYQDDKLTGVMEGSWSGNDTLWRTILDLNHVILFADAGGQLHNEPQRHYLAIVDGIMAGEHNGPMEHQVRNDGILIGGFNPVAVDYTAARVMRLNWQMIPQIARAIQNNFYPLFDFEIDEVVINSAFHIDEIPVTPFKVPKGWAVLELPSSELDAA